MPLRTQQAPPSAPLEGAIARLYEVFAKYPRGAAEGCPCCVSAAQQARLRAKRLRDLEGDDLEGFAFAALSTWGTLRDLKHYLPRILELAGRAAISTDLQVVFGKVRQEGPWLEKELVALEAYARALFAFRLDAMDAPACWVVVESAGLVGFDVGALLDECLTTESPQRASALARMVNVRAGDLANEKGFARWKDEAGICRAWSLSGAPRAFLQRVFERHLEHAQSDEWAAASDTLEALGG